jgi:hypothetical protein
MFAVKELPLVTRLPIVRELLTRAVSCVLRKRSAHSAPSGQAKIHFDGGLNGNGPVI